MADLQNQELVLKILKCAKKVPGFQGTQESLETKNFEQLTGLYQFLLAGETAAAERDKDHTERKRLADLAGLKIREFRQEQELKRIELFEHEQQLTETFNADQLDANYARESIDDYVNYAESAKNKLKFILPEFERVPFFPQNILLFGALTGHAKTGTLTEIMACTLLQGKRVLVVTNEETRASIYARLCFYMNKWPYKSMQNWTDQQRDTVFRFQKSCQTDNRLVVLDDSYPGFSKMTSSIEGMEAILSSVHRNQNDYGCIIFDYFHKIDTCKANPRKNEVEVLTEVSDRFEYYRKVLSCPIVIFCQLHPVRDDESFETRIKGRKRILESATFAAEIKVDTVTRITSFHGEKNRHDPDHRYDVVQVGYVASIGRYASINSIEFAQQRIANEKVESDREFAAELRRTEKTKKKEKKDDKK